jgi:hypothetical protein
MRKLTPLFACTAAVLLSTALPAQEAPTLPIYTTEEEAVNTLEAALEDAISKAEVTMDSLKPTEPLKEKGFVGIGIQANCSGSLEQVTTLLEELVKQPLCSFPAVNITEDRRTPDLIRTAIEWRQWYAKKEKAASKIKKWSRVAKASPSPFKLYRICADALPENGVRITSFSASKGTVTVIGQSSNANQGRSYGANLFERAEAMPGYSWLWLQRPAMDPRRKDGSATFRIQLNPKGEGLAPSTP